MALIPNFESVLRGLAFIAFVVIYLIVLTIETLLRPYYTKVSFIDVLLRNLKYKPNQYVLILFSYFFC
jgi:hypothetical protein